MSVSTDGCVCLCFSSWVAPPYLPSSVAPPSSMAAGRTDDEDEALLQSAFKKLRVDGQR